MSEEGSFEWKYDDVESLLCPGGPRPNALRLYFPELKSKGLGLRPCRHWGAAV